MLQGRISALEEELREAQLRAERAQEASAVLRAELAEAQKGAPARSTVAAESQAGASAGIAALEKQRDALRKRNSELEQQLQGVLAADGDCADAGERRDLMKSIARLRRENERLRDEAKDRDTRPAAAQPQVPPAAPPAPAAAASGAGESAELRATAAAFEKQRDALRKRNSELEQQLRQVLAAEGDCADAGERREYMVTIARLRREAEALRAQVRDAPAPAAPAPAEELSPTAAELESGRREAEARCGELAAELDQLRRTAEQQQQQQTAEAQPREPPQERPAGGDAAALRSRVAELERQLQEILDAKGDCSDAGERRELLVSIARLRRENEGLRSAAASPASTARTPPAPAGRSAAELSAPAVEAEELSLPQAAPPSNPLRQGSPPPSGESSAVSSAVRQELAEARRQLQAAREERDEAFAAAAEARKELSGVIDAAGDCADADERKGFMVRLARLRRDREDLQQELDRLRRELAADQKKPQGGGAEDGGPERRGASSAKRSTGGAEPRPAASAPPAAAQGLPSASAVPKPEGVALRALDAAGCAALLTKPLSVPRCLGLLEARDGHSAKKAYRRLWRLVHPDKVAHGTQAEQERAAAHRGVLQALDQCLWGASREVADECEQGDWADLASDDDSSSPPAASGRPSPAPRAPRSPEPAGDLLKENQELMAALAQQRRKAAELQAQLERLAAAGGAPAAPQKAGESAGPAARPVQTAAAAAEAAPAADEWQRRAEVAERRARAQAVELEALRMAQSGQRSPPAPAPSPTPAPTPSAHQRAQPTSAVLDRLSQLQAEITQLRGTVTAAQQSAPPPRRRPATG
eukprot:TRINITY_DN2414_c1_g2_i1.p1 TRINITY_DN2414_c1_g2~~TRINITY_DN2414_c1_g2_i1.p1  ORF type:complete len:908 (+),score=316.39 TRINITY_DN2414_c1_g2_i1:260-2725(+)